MAPSVIHCRMRHLLAGRRLAFQFQYKVAVVRLTGLYAIDSGVAVAGDIDKHRVTARGRPPRNDSRHTPGRIHFPESPRNSAQSPPQEAEAAEAAEVVVAARPVAAERMSREFEKRHHHTFRRHSP
jgi:hypothetical protein